MQGCGSGNIATRPLHLKYPCQVSNQIAKQQAISKSICLIPTPIDFKFECLLDDAYPTTQNTNNQTLRTASRIGFSPFWQLLRGCAPT